METKFQTSFIPKAPVTDSPVSRRSSGFGVLFLISFIIFMASVCGAAGTFFYNQIIDKKIVDGNDQLTKSKNIFDPTLVQEYTRLNDRITASYEILKKHIALSNVFDVISAVTLKSARFTNFTYGNAGGDKVTLNMNGQAPSYETVALQARALSDPSMKYRNAFKSPLFGNITSDAQGNVSFNLSTSLDPTVISYYRLVQDLKKAGLLDAYANIGLQVSTVDTSISTSTDKSVRPNVPQPVNRNKINP
ncbi:MAG: hypothetical protein WCG97_03010 [bacterium]